MKTRYLIGIAALTLSIIVGLASCDLFGISIQARITQFTGDLNSARSNLANDISYSSLDTQAGVLDTI